MGELNFVNVIFTVFSLIALAIPGFILAKCKMLGEKASETISNIVLFVCQPALVFKGFQGENFSADIGINMLIVAGLTFAVHLVMTGVMFVCVRNKDNDAKLNCLRFASIFGNCGFMGLPMIDSLFNGNGETLIYCAVVLAVFNILSWTLGVYIMTKDRKQISIKKIVLNPTIIAVILGFLIFVIAKVPIVKLFDENTTGGIIISKLMYSIDLLASTVTPMAMMVIGIKLAKANIKQIFLDKTSYFCCGYKLVIASIVTVLLVTFLPISKEVKLVMFFLMSVPSATSTTLFAVKFNSDADSASIMVLLTSILSMSTIPLMFLLYTATCGAFLG